MDEYEGKTFTMPIKNTLIEELQDCKNLCSKRETGLADLCGRTISYIEESIKDKVKNDELVCSYVETIAKMCEELAALKARNEKAEEAIRYYANEGTYNSDGAPEVWFHSDRCDGNCDGECDVYADLDKGEVAREYFTSLAGGNDGKP